MPCISDVAVRVCVLYESSAVQLERKMGDMAKILHLMESLLTGHDEIDREHAQIFDTLNALNVMLCAQAKNAHAQKTHAKPDAARDQTNVLFDKLIEQCKDHFHHEERVLSDAKYSELLEHVADHERALNLMVKMRKKCSAEKDQETSLQCFHDMLNLLVDEIVRNDMSFVSFLEEQRIVRRKPLHNGLLSSHRHEFPLAADRPETSL